MFDLSDKDTPSSDLWVIVSVSKTYPSKHNSDTIILRMSEDLASYGILEDAVFAEDTLLDEWQSRGLAAGLYRLTVSLIFEDDDDELEVEDLDVTNVECLYTY